MAHHNLVDHSVCSFVNKPLAVLSPMMTWATVFPYPPIGFSVSTGVISVTSPEQGTKETINTSISQQR